MGKLLSFDGRQPELVSSECAQSEPMRAIYYGVFFRDRNGRLQLVTDNFYAERGRAEMFVELYERCRAEGMTTHYFVGTLSVPASEKEQANA